MKHEPIELTGCLRIDVLDQAGRIVEHRHVENLVVLAGRNAVRDGLATGTLPGLDEMAVGTGTTAAAAGDTALEAQVARDTLTDIDADTDGEVTAQWYVSSTTANGSALTEAGLFLSDGTLLARTTFAAINKTSSTAVTFTWTVSIAGS